MVNLGDALTVIGILVGVCLSSWAVLMGFIGLFPRRAEAASITVQQHPWRATLVGLVLWLALGTVGLILIGLPNPVTKLIGLIVLMVLVAFTSVGASGMAKLIGKRLRALDSQMSEYGAISRASLILVTSPLVPLVGWFAIVPMLLATGLGSGISAVFAKMPATPTAEPQFEYGN